MLELLRDQSSKLFDKSGDILDDIEIIVANHRRQVNRIGGGVKIVGGVGVQKGGMGAATAECSQIIAFAAGNLRDGIGMADRIKQGQMLAES